MIHGPERFAHDTDYDTHLYGAFISGELQADVVDADKKRALLAATLAENLTPGIYLEVGQNAEPYCATSGRAFRSDARYVGIDGGQSSYMHQTAGEQVGWTFYGRDNAANDMRIAAHLVQENLGPSGAIIWGDAQRLPLPDAQSATAPVQEAFMRDVVEQPMMHPRSMTRIFSEQARVLGTTGRLVIRETYSSAAIGQPDMQFIRVLGALENAGFTERTFIDDYASAAPLLKRSFPGGSEGLGTNGYYLVCQQGEKPKARTRTERLRLAWAKVFPQLS